MARLNHKRGRKSNYVKSLNNEYHKSVREKALLRDNFKCRICGQRIRLELHHITYYDKGINIIGKELEHMNCVVIVCENHHQEIHQNINHKWNPKNRNKQLL